MGVIHVGNEDVRIQIPCKINRLDPKFLKQGTNDKHVEEFHPIVRIPGVGCNMRGRSEMIVLDENNRMYLSTKKEGLCSFSDSFFYNEKFGGFTKHGDSTKKDGFLYDVPGGGWMPGETPMHTAIRETREEARINVIDVKYIGDYVVYYDEPKDWVKKEIPLADQWRGYFTSVYIGTFDGKYDGEIDESDRDVIIETGDFIDLSIIAHKLNPVHMIAIAAYNKIMENPDLYKEIRIPISKYIPLSLFNYHDYQIIDDTYILSNINRLTDITNNLSNMVDHVSEQLVLIGEMIQIVNTSEKNSFLSIEQKILELTKTIKEFKEEK